MARQTDTDERGSVHGVNPGTELGRYTVGTRIEEVRGGERWMARDTTLDRDVSLLIMPAGTDATAAALDAARRAAGVEAAQLVRILDVGTEAETSFIAEDGVSGARSLAETIGRHGLPAEEVRRITGEVATGIESARARGLHHLALTPDTVLLTSDGRVKVRGLATTAALAGIETEGEEADRQDASAVVALAYAGLTATWPLEGMAGMAGMEATSSLPAATREGGKLVAPSRVAVGVPGDLDTICRETLVDGTGPVSPGDYAAQIAPWSRIPLAGAVRTTGAATSPTASTGEGDSSTTRGEQSAASGSDREGTDEAGGAADTDVLPTTGAGAAGDDGDGAEADDGDPGGTGTADGEGSGHEDAGGASNQGEGQARAAGAAAAAAGAMGSGGKVIGDRLGKAARSAGDRSRGAMHDARLRREAIRADQRARTSLGAAPVSAEIEPPAPMLPADSGGPPSRRQSNLVVLLMTLVVVAACAVGSYGITTIGDGSDLGSILAGDDDQVMPTTEPSTTSDTGGDGGGGGSDSDEPLGIINAAGYDPSGDGVEHNAEAARIYDGNPDTAWETEGYATPDFGGMKQGVGITVDLGQQQEVSSVELNLPSTADATVYVGDQPTNSGTQLGQTNQSGEVTLEADQPIQGQYVTVWFTSLAPSDDGRHRASLAEIVVR